MAELQRYRSFVLTYNSTTQTFEVGNTARIWVFSQGAYKSGSQATSNGASMLVYSSGSFIASDFAQFGVGGPIYSVSGTDATHITLGTLMSGSAVTATDGMRILNLGTAADKTGSTAVVYSVDSDTATPHNWLTQGALTADTSGNYEFYANTGTYDALIQNSSAVDLYIESDIAIGSVARSSATGVVYLPNPDDDFSVGGSTLATSAFYVDKSAELVYIGGTTAPLVTLDGTNARVTINSAAAQPQLLLTNSTTFTNTLTTSHTGARTFTLPDITGTAIVDAGTQTITGAKTFTGGMTVSTTALTVSSATTISGTLAVSNTATFTGATTDHKRVLSTQDTALTAGAFTLTGWGSGAAVVMDTVDTTPIGSRDQRFSFTVTTGTTASPNPTIKIVWSGLTWGSAPKVMVVRNGGTASTSNALSWVTTPTQVTITYNGTPSDGSTLPIVGYAWG